MVSFRFGFPLNQGKKGTPRNTPLDSGMASLHVSCVSRRQGGLETNTNFSPLGNLTPMVGVMLVFLCKVP